MVVFDLLKRQTAARTLFEWVYYHHFRKIAIAKENLERKHFPLIDFWPEESMEHTSVIHEEYQQAYSLIALTF